MDGDRFDALVRRFDHQATRRGLVGTVALLAGSDLARGKRKEKRKKEKEVQAAMHRASAKMHEHVPQLLPGLPGQPASL